MEQVNNFFERKNQQYLDAEPHEIYSNHPHFKVQISTKIHPMTLKFTRRLCFPETSDKALSRKQRVLFLCIVSILQGQIQTACVDTYHSCRQALGWHHWRRDQQSWGAEIGSQAEARVGEGPGQGEAGLLVPLGLYRVK